MKGRGVPTELAEVTRGGIRESLHHGIVAVADSDGKIVASAGDPDRVAFFRSSAKPFQAIPLIESGAAERFGFTPAELALCCASHAGSREHQRQVAAMLAKLELDVPALQCGVVRPGDAEEAGRVSAGLIAPSPLQCDCSGKHSGMLAACLQLRLPVDNYLDPDHPLQQQILEIMAAVMQVPADSIALGTDGCSLPTFAGSIGSFAASYAILARSTAGGGAADVPHGEALRRLGAAMVAHPENVSGHGQLVTDLMIVGEGQDRSKERRRGSALLWATGVGVGCGDPSPRRLVPIPHGDCGTGTRGVGSGSQDRNDRASPPPRPPHPQPQSPPRWRSPGGVSA